MLHRLLDVFASLNSRGVKYLVIGGLAAIAHGVSRETSDLDILIQPAIANADRLLIALDAAGFFIDPPPTCAKLLGNAVTPYTDRDLDRKLDVHTHMEKTNFDKAWRRKAKKIYKSQAFYVLSRKDLIAFKRASGREIDLEDVRLLDPGP